MAGEQKASTAGTLIEKQSVSSWLEGKPSVIGEAALELLHMAGIPSAVSGVARNEDEAVEFAIENGFPVVMKVSSPDALHKTDAGGVVLDVKNEDQARKTFALIRNNLIAYKKDAQFNGVTVQRMVADGYDMFIGGKFDSSFGPIVVFGFGGIYVEVFKDVCTCLCPAGPDLVRKKIESLKSFKILKGMRGMRPADVNGYIDAIVRVSLLLAEFPEIKEFDINPLRLFKDGSGVRALDARMRIEK
jgi:acyl-CoA synthetase (NDP forming)